MESYIIYEIIGYIASVLIAVSLMMSKIVRLRIVNLIGSATFSLYGVLIGSIPVAAMNGFIVLVNVYHLAKIFYSEEYLKLLKVESHSDYLEYFIDFYKKEIQSFQPEFDFQISEDDLCLFVLRDMVPAGLLIGDKNEAGKLRVKLDFVMPSYRDFKVGRYLFDSKRPYFKELGIREIVAKAGNETHSNYLEKMGFEPVSSKKTEYSLNLE